MKFEMKRIVVPFELKNFNEGDGIFEGYAAVFDVVDSGNDKILPGAFDEAIKELGPKGSDRIKILVMHKQEWLPIGKPIEIKEDKIGLYVKGKISSTSMGSDVKILMKDGVFNELSIGYVATDYSFDGDGVRNIKKAAVFEFGPVIWAMNQKAKIMSYKGMEEGEENDMLEFKFGEKSITFEDALMESQIQELGWQIDRAMRVSIESVIHDEELGSIQKIAEIDNILGEYHKAMLELFSKSLELREKESKDVNIEMMLDQVTQEVKAGASLSKVNKDKLSKVIEKLQEMVGKPKKPEENEEDKKKKDKEKKDLEDIMLAIKGVSDALNPSSNDEDAEDPEEQQE